VKEIHQSPFGNGIEQQHSPFRIPLCARLVPKLSFVGNIISVLDFYDKQQFVCQPQYLKELIIKYIKKKLKIKIYMKHFLIFFAYLQHNGNSSQSSRSVVGMNCS
jgi:hypothetical protein